MVYILSENAAKFYEVNQNEDFFFFKEESWMKMWVYLITFKHCKYLL